MQFIVNFLRGSVCFTVCGPFPERFLNLCAQNGVGFWGLVWLDAQTLELKVARRDARRVRGLAVMALIFVYRPTGLRQYVAQPDARRLLAARGYPATSRSVASPV